MLHITTVAGSCMPQYLQAWSGSSLLLYKASSSSSNCSSGIVLVTLEILDDNSTRPIPLTYNVINVNSYWSFCELKWCVFGGVLHTWLDEDNPWSCCEACVWLWDGNVKSVNSNSEPWVSAPIKSPSSVSRNVSDCELGSNASTLIFNDEFKQTKLIQKKIYRTTIGWYFHSSHAVIQTTHKSWRKFDMLTHGLFPYKVLYKLSVILFVN